MRLFVAIWPPAEVVRELAVAVAEAQRDVPEARWVPEAHWHLTLTFLGEVDDARREELDRRLARAATRHAPMRLRFQGAGRLSDRVLFARVEGERDALRRVAASTSAAARRSGVVVDGRPYRPHLTLARSRAQGGSGAVLAPAAQALEGFQGREWTASELHLVCSRLGAGPGRTSSYESVARWPLSGRTS
jgi:2'-5' RNA ligase